MADTPGTAAAAAAVFGKVARKGKRKGSKRRRVAGEEVLAVHSSTPSTRWCWQVLTDEEEEVVSAATLQDIRDEQRVSKVAR